MTTYPHPACMEPDGGDGPCVGYKSLEAKALTKDELNLVRQWFDATQDLTQNYLERPDYILARRVYEALQMRVPLSISEKC